jgi:regulator of replication initiation timing
MIILRPTWNNWVHLLALRYGQVLSERETGWLLWERTAYPMTTDLAYLGRQVHEALEQPMDDEEFMDAQDPLNREADRLAIELGHVARDLQDMVTEVATLRAENARLEETVAGWRAENDRHRHQYVEAERARQDAVVERDRLRAEIEEERDINLASGCPDCGVHDGCYRVVVERDELRHLVKDLWAAWNDDTLALFHALREHVAGPPVKDSTLDLTPEQATLLEATIRWAHTEGKAHG